LAEAAQSLGMGPDVPDFRPRGAIEVQRASLAFLQMRERIERHVEQRTAMLAGVSHDLRTMLTRFKLQLAVLGDSAEVKELQHDVNEMQHMLEDYVAFVRGDGGEVSVDTDVGAMIEDICHRAATTDVPVTVQAPGKLTVAVKPNAFKRCIANLIGNAVRFATRVEILVERDDRYLRIAVDD